MPYKNQNISTRHQMKCPICGNDSYANSRFNRRDYFFYQCGKCRLGFISPQPSISETQNYYRTEYYGTKAKVIDKKSHPDTGWIKKILKRINPRAKTIVEYGCGCGSLLYELKHSGFSVTGYDPSIQAIATAQNLLDGAMITVDLKKIQGKKYDVLLMRHVLEHLLALKDEFHEIVSMLNIDGCAIIGVPNFGSLASRILMKKHKWFDPPVHLFYFNRISLSRFLASNGFRLIECRTKLGDYEGFMVNLYNALRSKDAFSNGIKTETEKDKSQGNSMVRGFKTVLKKIIVCFIRAVDVIFYPWIMIINAVGLGEELWMVAKK